MDILLDPYLPTLNSVKKTIHLRKNELFLTYCNSTAFSTSFPTIFPTVVKGSIKITLILKLRRAESLNLKTIRQFINVPIRPYKRQKSMLHFTALRGVRAHENVEHEQCR